MCAASRSKHSCSVSCENLIAPLSIIRWRASSGWTTSAWKERLVAERAARWRALSQCSKTHVEDTQSRLVATCRISRRRTSSGSAARQRADSSIRRTLRELCAREPNYGTALHLRIVYLNMRLMRGLKTIHVASLKTKPNVSRNVCAFPAHTHTSHIPWYRSPLVGRCMPHNARRGRVRTNQPHARHEGGPLMRTPRFTAPSLSLHALFTFAPPRCHVPSHESGTAPCPYTAWEKGT